LSLIRFFASILHGRPKGGGAIPEQINRPDEDGNALTADSDPAGGLEQVRHAIEHVIDLLIEPTPAAIRQAGLLLENADERLRCAAACQQGKHSREHILEVENVTLRARRLIEGALRIQWAQMRRISAVTQTYIPGGKVSQFYPAAPGFDVKI